MSRSIPRLSLSPGLAALAVIGALVASGCGEGEGDGSSAEDAATAEDQSRYEFASMEEMEIELETIDLEIQGLEEYLAANPGWVGPDPSDPDPRTILEAARATRHAAGVALAAADTDRAADSLHAAGARIEHVKRLLGVAEEMGIEYEPVAESLPPIE
jgi:hypothetical protein